MHALAGFGCTCRPAMIAVSCCMALMYLILSLVDTGTVPPSDARRSSAAAIERSCCEVTGIWQWVGYRCHVSENQKRCVDGM